MILASAPFGFPSPQTSKPTPIPDLHPMVHFSFSFLNRFFAIIRAARAARLTTVVEFLYDDDDDDMMMMMMIIIIIIIISQKVKNHPTLL